jgi:5'-nucleotidase
VDRAVPAGDLTRLVGQYKTLVDPIASRVLGTVATAVTRAQSPAGESQLGDLIADAQLADLSVVTAGQVPQIAFMNPGGIRTDLEAGEVTYGEAFAVQPFNNYLVSMTMTGAQIHDLLEQQWSGANAGTARKILQVSEGFSYRWDPATATLDPGSVTLGGQPVPDDASTSYRVVANSFLADGGDGFAAFTQATGKYFGGLDIDAFADYLAAHSPYTPGPLDRIRVTGA